MTSIPNQTLPSGTSGHNPLSDAQFSRYVRKESFHTRESLSAGLTIETKEGDLVTLTSRSYSEMDTFQYDERGVLQTSRGKADVSRHIREISLSSGDQFSFTVEGDLSREELDDIEAIVKGIDAVIAEVARGDMDDAVEKALSMGGYDSISMYSADIAHEKTTAVRSEIETKTQRHIPNAYTGPREEGAAGSLEDLFDENKTLRERDLASLKYMDKIAREMTDALKARDEKLVLMAKKPINKLFKHHLADMRHMKGEEMQKFNTIDRVRKEMEKWMDELSDSFFTGQLPG